jgi:hypothetical protein
MTSGEVPESNFLFSGTNYTRVVICANYHAAGTHQLIDEKRWPADHGMLAA